MASNKNVILSDLKSVEKGYHLQRSLYLGFNTTNFNETFTKMMQLGAGNKSVTSAVNHFEDFENGSYIINNNTNKNIGWLQCCQHTMNSCICILTYLKFMFIRGRFTPSSNLIHLYLPCGKHERTQCPYVCVHREITTYVS